MSFGIGHFFAVRYLKKVGPPNRESIYIYIYIERESLYIYIYICTNIFVIVGILHTEIRAGK